MPRTQHPQLVGCFCEEVRQGSLTYPLTLPMKSTIFSSFPLTKQLFKRGQLEPQTEDIITL